jgi:hypothetical protein
VGEVADRCRQLGLLGGVAEYGGVIWDSSAQSQTVLLEEDRLAMVANLRDAAVRAGFLVDAGRLTSVRVFELSDMGRRGIPPDAVRANLPNSLLNEFEIIEDVHSTDLVCCGMDKGVGLRALLDRLGLRSASLYAVGDAHPDLPMMAMATHRFAPNNASREIMMAVSTLNIGVALRRGGACMTTSSSTGQWTLALPLWRNRSISSLTSNFLRLSSTIFKSSTAGWVRQSLSSCSSA